MDVSLAIIMSLGISRSELSAPCSVFRISMMLFHVQAVLNSLGGVQLLFPILEQVDLPVRDRQCDGTEGSEDVSQNPKIPSLHGTVLRLPSCSYDFDGAWSLLGVCVLSPVAAGLLPQRKRVWLHFFDSSCL